MELFKPRSPSPSPWIVLCLSHMFPTYPRLIEQVEDLPDNVAIALEMKVLLAQPQPHWALLLKVSTSLFYLPM